MGKASGVNGWCRARFADSNEMCINVGINTASSWLRKHSTCKNKRPFTAATANTAPKGRLALDGTLMSDTKRKRSL